jgi:uncharacterized protein (TIGR03437 family)
MDAAQKLTYRSILLFITLALVLSAPAWGQPSFQLSQRSITNSGTVFPPGFISVNSSDANNQITWTGTIDYSQDTNTNGAWLSASPLSGTTPGQINIALGNVSNLVQGIHTAIIHLTGTSASGNPAPVDITVTFNSSSSGGGSGTLFSSISPINMSVAPGFQTFSSPTISTSSISPISITASTSTTSCGSGWLTAFFGGSSLTSISSTAPATLTVTANAVSLPSGTCTGTITISPSTGVALTIPVNLTVGSGTGSNLTVFPNPASLQYVSGGQLPSTTVSMSSSSGVQFVNAVVTNCAQGWLIVNGFANAGNVPIQNGLTIAANANATGLTTNTYTCSVSLADASNPGVVLTNLTVNLSVNGGSSSGLTITPNPISFSAPFNGSQQSTTVTVASQQSGTLTISNNGCTWLTFNGSGFFINAGGTASVSVFANPFGLSVNNYSCTLTFTVGGLSTNVPVSFAVGTGGGTGSTAAAPSTVNLIYQQSASPSFASHPAVSITGPDGTWTTNVSYSSGATNWLALSPASGTLPLNNTLTLGANIAGLAVGNYSATLTITTQGGTATVIVNLAVVTGNIIYTSPGSANFFYNIGSGTPSAQTIFVGNSDGSALSFTTTASDTWVTVQQNPGSGIFSVSVDPTGKSAGIYTSSVVLTEASATNSPSSMPVVLVVSGSGGGGGTLIFSPSGTLSLSSNTGSTQSQTLSVSANVATTFTVASDQTWLTTSATAGTTNTNLTVFANPTGLTNNNTYTGHLTFNYNGNSQTVTVAFTVGSSSGGGALSVTCTSSCGATQPAMAFTGQVGAGSLQIGGLRVTSASGSSQIAFTVTATTTSGGNWLSTSVGNAVVNTPFDPLTVNVNVGTGANALAAGTYNGNIALTPQGGGSTVNVPVTLTVTAPPTVSATPTTLTFSYRVGDAAPAGQTVTVSGGSASSALSFGVTVSPAGQWLVATPTTGTTPGTVTVSINTTGLSAQTYTGTVTIAGTSGALGTTTIQVSLTVTAPLPTVDRVVNAASYLAAGISPGEIITLFASDATHAIGPSTPVGLQLDSSGKVATTLGGVQVLINGFASPMIYASATQLSAVVPYEVAPLVSATVLVKYLGQSSNGVPVNVQTTSPGIFTLNSSGTGPGAILNSNNSVNSPNNPANRGDVVVIYMTGEGQTSPAGVTGKVTVASSTPPFTPGPLLPIGITIGGQAANYSFAGEAPGFVSGVMQLNVTVPTNISAGDVPLVVSIGGRPSQSGVTVSIR